MRAFFIVLLILTLGVTFSRNAHAAKLPNSADVRCLILGIRISGAADAAQSAAGNMLAYYYYGRLADVAQEDLANAMRYEFAHMTPDEIRSETRRCGATLVETGKSMQQIAQTIPKQNGLDTRAPQTP